VLTGWTEPSDRYFASLHVRDASGVSTANWNDQKAVLTGYTQPGNKYFATRQRLSYHPRDKTFLTPGTGSSGSSTQTAPPPPQPEQSQPEAKPQSSSGKKSKQQELEEFEKEYLVRYAQEQEESVKAEEASGQTASKKGAMPKGF